MESGQGMTMSRCLPSVHDYLVPSVFHFAYSPLTLSTLRYAVRLLENVRSSWITWSHIWPTSCLTAKRAQCSPQVKGVSWRRMLSRPGNIARTLCSTWRLVRFEGEGAHSPSKQKMFSIKFTGNAENKLFFLSFPPLFQWKRMSQCLVRICQSCRISHLI